MFTWVFDENKLNESFSKQNELLAAREIFQNAVDATSVSNEDLDNVEFKILRLNQTSIFCYN